MKTYWTARVKVPTRVYESERGLSLLSTRMVLPRGEQVVVIGGAEIRWFDQTEYRVLPVQIDGQRYFVRADDV